MRTINLALQGGGSHGAFTWGVLDALLADPRIGLEGLSGTSAGAVNAVVLASGYAKARQAGHDPRQGARDALAKLWHTIASWDALGTWQRQWARLLWGGAALDHGGDWLNRAVGSSLSPYQSNPLDLNPLRDLLRDQVDFHAIAEGPLKVFATATHVPTGRAVIFTGARLDAAAVLASACLPQLFKAVEIGGEPYWDGGYSANPALAPLIQGCSSADLMLIQINPLRVAGVPQTSSDIDERVNELTFNASLLTQMRTIEYFNSLLERGALRGGHKTVRMHRVDGGEAIRAFPGSTKTSTDAAMIDALFHIGQQAATHWLQRHYDALGHHSTVDIRRDYLDDTRVLVDRPGVATERPSRGFRPWLAQLLRRRPYGK